MIVMIEQLEINLRESCGYNLEIKGVKDLGWQIRRNTRLEFVWEIFSILM